MPTERQKQGGDYIREELKSGERQKKKKNSGSAPSSMCMCIHLGIDGGVKIDLMVLILNQSWVYVGDDTDSIVLAFRYGWKTSCENITVKNNPWNTRFVSHLLQ